MPARNSVSFATDENEAASSQPLLAQTDSPEPSPRSRRDTYIDAETNDIVQFGAPVFYAEEASGVAELEILRLGKKTGTVSFSYTTIEKSAQADVKYVPQTGTISLEPGVGGHIVKIVLIKPNMWWPSLEFAVSLQEAEGCQLGRSLSSCRVKLINPCLFPSDKWGNLVKKKKDLDGISGVDLFREFTKDMIQLIPGLRWRIILTICMDQLRNFQLLYMLNAQIYLVNKVLAKGSENDDTLIFPRQPETSAYLIGVMYVVPSIFCFAWESAKIRVALMGTVELTLQGFVFRRYLNFSEESRGKVKEAELLEFVNTTSHRLALGFDGMVSLGQLVGKLVILLYFMLSHNPGAVWALFVMPAVVVAWAAFRDGCLDKALGPGRPRAKLNDFIMEAVVCYRLVASYFQRPRMNDLFHEKSQFLTDTIRKFNFVENNTAAIFDFLGPAFIGSFVAFNVRSVLAGSTSMGSFLATINVLKEVAMLSQAAFNAVRQVTKQFSPLRKYSVFLNMATDLKHLKKIQENRKAETGNRRATLRKTLGGDGGAFLIDKIPLELKNITFAYRLHGISKLVMENRSATVEQGKLVTVIGKAGKSGVHTLMKMLGGELFPNKGEVFIPSHLRVLWVTRAPFVMDLPIYDNLVFHAGSRDDADEVRVKQIVDALGMERIHIMLEEELKGVVSAKWWNEVTESDIKKIHIARALIMNAEVMVMQRPTLGMEESDRNMVVALIRQHVENRGLFLDPMTVHMRRPRTVFVSAVRPWGNEEIDVIWEVDDVSTMHVLTPDEFLTEADDRTPIERLNKPKLPSFKIHSHEYYPNEYPCVYEPPVIEEEALEVAGGEALNGRKQGRQDDLEAAGYVLDGIKQGGQEDLEAAGNEAADASATTLESSKAVSTPGAAAEAPQDPRQLERMAHLEPAVEDTTVACGDGCFGVQQLTSQSRDQRNVDSFKRGSKEQLPAQAEMSSRVEASVPRVPEIELAPRVQEALAELSRQEALAELPGNIDIVPRSPAGSKKNPVKAFRLRQVAS
mmetsp:Transcript_57781/g.102560  ORF Transcript_57781/g.102560 Transcript_57781/m.102560 type:complete len:1023 (+) Transcript_57781:63-3131(+)